MGVDQSTVTRRLFALTDLDPAEQPGPLAAPPEVAPKACDLPALCAFLLYLALAILFFGRALFGHFSTFHIGMSQDPRAMIWFLAWWPHAIAKHINPLLTHAIWAPAGYNLAWQTCIPLASIIISPLTLILGPVVSFNILCLLSLPLNASCMFVLCRYVTRDYSASLMGGYVFGFSAFMLGRLTFGHLPLLLAFPVPLIVYIVTFHFVEQTAKRAFVLALTVLLVMQFFLFIEIFATMTMLGASALFMSWFFGTTATRQRMVALIKPIVYSYGITTIVVSPYLYYFYYFNFGLLDRSLWLPSVYCTDLLNFVMPTQANELGKISFFKSMSTAFSGSIADNGSCLSLPLVALSVHYAYRHWREPTGKLLTCCLILVAILTLGPTLHVAGHMFPVLLPWSLLAKLPVLNQALPVRLSMYTFLLLALIVSLWLSTTQAKTALKITFATAVIVFNAPNLSSAFWIRPTNTPAFFAEKLYRQYLQKGETVVILPYADQGNGALWQAQTHMYFDMAEGEGGPWPDYFLKWPIVESFRIQSYVPDASGQLKVFLAAHDVTAVIVADGDLGQWQPLLSTLGVAPTRVGGVSLYRLKSNRAYDAETLLVDARTRFDNDRMAMLVRVASKYLADGGDIESLSMVKVRDLDLISKESLVGPDLAFDPLNSPHQRPISDPRFVYMLWLSPWMKGRIAIGEYVWFPTAAPMVERLRSLGTEIYYPVPDKESRFPQSKLDDYRFLLVVLTREELARAAELLEMPPAQKTSSRNGAIAPAALKH
jgi:hypothetical protein